MLWSLLMVGSMTRTLVCEFVLPHARHCDSAVCLTGSAAATAHSGMVDASCAAGASLR